MPIRNNQEADMRRLIEAGVTGTQIGARGRISRGTAARAWAHIEQLSVPEKFTLNTVVLDGGHMVWTGERDQGLAPVLTHRGRKLSVRKIAYGIEHGHPPVGSTKSACEYAWCVAPEHQADAALDSDNARSFAAQLDAAAERLGAN
ncbi:hypothetical protein [Streptomyces cylindrosporus]|uniref:Uncharacterized protein n=1 Tax=Streptomyces cylindrosporus TaxID=2927583 RepID=A0ABS9YJX9_9ACTN|nr:hypothetical protein [Streptomyces cylindrosporus]MCI3277568.1 hypothetical protein [Streptomyces cylindrosporus]